ncbi:MAG: tetratricopeptide repeat protein, partial [Fimbriimonadales bacterium]|nr:tetratricopeptide repeat protein [Fimbriimonadales bacterium]
MECGARLREDTTDPLYAEGSDREVYPEIARANLLRMQGRYEEAVEVCLGILKRYPSNETAHALLGDIHADQGKLTDAVQWYELLVDLAPGNPVYRAKLDQLRSIQVAQQAQVAAPPPAPAAGVPSTRVWVYLLGGLLALILIGAAFVAGRRMT